MSTAWSEQQLASHALGVHDTYSNAQDAWNIDIKTAAKHESGAILGS